MSPAPHAPATVRPGRWRAGFRVLVLLLALAAPCGHLPAQAVTAGAVAGAAGSGEYDHLDSALRMPGRGGRQAAVAPAGSTRVRPAPFVPLMRAPSALPSLAAPAVPYRPRFVVLRC